MATFYEINISQINMILFSLIIAIITRISVTNEKLGIIKKKNIRAVWEGKDSPFVVHFTNSI